MNDRPEPVPTIDTTELPAGVPMLTHAQVATMLQVGVRTVWRLIAQNRFPRPIKITPKTTRFLVADVQAWIDSKRALGPADPEAPVQPVAPVPTDLIPLKSAARLLACAVSTITRFTQTGRLPAFRKGGCMVVSRAQVEALMQPFRAGPEVTQAACQPLQIDPD